MTFDFYFNIRLVENRYPYGLVRTFDLRTCTNLPHILYGGIWRRGTIGVNRKEGIPSLSLVEKVFWDGAYSRLVEYDGEVKMNYPLVVSALQRPVRFLLRVIPKSAGNEVWNYSLPPFEVTV